MLWANMEQITDLLRNNIWYFVGGILGLIVIVALFKLLGGKKKSHKDLEKSQREILDDYPPAPKAGGSRTLLLDGLAVRVRLVVVAPMGKQQDRITADDVPELLNDVLRGLGKVVEGDKARIRVWPGQLSTGGFAPAFFRLVESPDDEGKKSHWIRVAGPAKAAGRPILLGLALYADEINKLGRLPLEGKEWVESLQIEK